MPNFKVNSKSSILEFKRKHNNLVDNIDTELAKKADKVTINSIEIVTIDENTKQIIFPEGIMPLRVNMIVETFEGNRYFDYSSHSLWSFNSREFVKDTRFTLTYNNGKYCVTYSSSVDVEIIDMTYINNIVHDDAMIDARNIYFPKGGTQLYKYMVEFEVSSPDYDVISMIFYSRDNESINDIDGLITQVIRPFDDYGFIPTINSMMVGYNGKVLSMYYNRSSSQLELIILITGNTSLSSINIPLTGTTISGSGTEV